MKLKGGITEALQRRFREEKTFRILADLSLQFHKLLERVFPKFEAPENRPDCIPNTALQH